jgi:hypothetical protein
MRTSTSTVMMALPTMTNGFRARREGRVGIGT